MSSNCSNPLMDDLWMFERLFEVESQAGSENNWVTNIEARE